MGEKCIKKMCSYVYNNRSSFLFFSLLLALEKLEPNRKKERKYSKTTLYLDFKRSFSKQTPVHLPLIIRPIFSDLH